MAHASKLEEVADGMSRFGSKADITCTAANVRFVPKADIARNEISGFFGRPNVRFGAAVGLRTRCINPRARSYVLVACAVLGQRYPNSHLSIHVDLVRFFELANIATY